MVTFPYATVTRDKRVVWDCTTTKVIATACNEFSFFEMVTLKTAVGSAHAQSAAIFKSILLRQVGSALSLRLNGVKLAITCNLFLVMR